MIDTKVHTSLRTRQVIDRPFNGFNSNKLFAPQYLTKRDSKRTLRLDFYIHARLADLLGIRMCSGKSSRE